MQHQIPVRQFADAAISNLEKRQGMLRAELNEIEDELGAWRIILKRNGDTGEVINDEVPSDVAASPLKVKRSTQAKRSGEGLTITETARKLMRDAGNKGFEPRDITHTLRASGFTVHPTIGSNIVHRLRAKGEIVPAGNRYYLTGQAPPWAQFKQQTPP